MTDVTMAELARSHGNCNIICMGGRITGSAVAIDMVKKFLATEFEGGRHEKRINLFSS